jgi:hypothetical protein
MANRTLVTQYPNLATPRPPLKVADGETIYKGDFVALDSSGDAIQAPTTGASTFLGIAKNYYDNASGGAVTSERVLHFQPVAFLVQAVTGATTATIGAKVYYTGAQTLSMTKVASTGVEGSQVGRLHGFTVDDTPIIDLTKNEFEA